jgi:hypothetical protein
MRLSLVLITCLVACLVSSWFGIARAEGASCNASDRSVGKFLFSNVSRVTKAKLFFRNNPVNNPVKAGKAFVVKGDFVAVRNVKPYGSCALFINPRGQESIGWLETNGLEDIANAGLQDMANRWRLKRAGTSIEIKLVPAGQKSRFEARLSGPNQPVAKLSGSLTLEAEAGPAFTLAAKLNSKTACRLSGVFLGDFMRIFSDDKGCSDFAGVYAKITN